MGDDDTSGEITLVRPHGPGRHPAGALALLALLAFALPLPLPARPAQPASPADPPPPEALFKDLFDAVQSAALYGDGKTFVDAVPRESPAKILAEYHAAHPDSPEALRQFVAAHFELPAQPPAVASAPAQTSITAHIDELWARLTRDTPTAPPYSSLLPLPAPYVVPGGRFREIYYWDSYFTMLGLVESGREDLVNDMVRDFADLVDRYGHVPNGTRTYYLSRSQPPFFFDMVGLLAKERPAGAYARYEAQLKREYRFWMDGEGGLRPGGAHRRVVALPDGSILNRYWDDRDTPRDESWREDTQLARSSGRSAPEVYRNIRAAAESGWDFSSRWFADGRTKATIDTTEIVPVDLNSLLYGLEVAIEEACDQHGEHGCHMEFAHRAKVRREAIDRYLWDAPTGAYLDYHWTEGAPVARVSAATLYPLFVGIASKAQAAAVATTVARTLLQPGGLVTSPLATGEQWDAPNGWAPLQWIGVEGLRRYGESELARSIACRWTLNVRRVYQQTGKLVEKYDVTDLGRAGGGGEYPTQDGFGWTNGVTRRLMALYPADAAATQCP